MIDAVGNIVDRVRDLPTPRTPPSEEGANAVRAFTRFYTRVAGVLSEGLLDTAFTLTEARVIFELAQAEAVEVAELRAALDLDSGYLSRILARFEAAGLVERDRSSFDGRRRRARLTDRGSETYAVLDARSAARTRELLEPLADPEQRRLVGAMREIRRILENGPEARSFQLREPRPGDLGWVVQRHGERYAEDYGWDASFEALVAGIVADYAREHVPDRERAWIAESAGEPIGCVFCVRKDAAVAQLRLLHVERSARGMGVGTALVEECLRFARAAGYRELTLWTNSILVEARRIYERAGFQLVSEAPHRSFGHDLVEQTWTKPLV
jgi:DNA-binding MarR family transcriptional regulator/GNAT superfamily N-acetyltransferase